MTNVVRLFITQFHFLIVAYALYGIYEGYTLHQAQLQDLLNQKDPINTQIGQQKKKLRDIEDFKKNLISSKKRVRELAVQIEEIQKRLPNTISDTELLGTIREDLDLLRIMDAKLNPQAEKEEGFYFSKEYKLQGEGTYLQILVFFERLLFKERLLNVKDLKMVKQKKMQKGEYQFVDFETTIEAYRYNPKYLDVSDLKETEEEKKEKEKKEKKENEVNEVEETKLDNKKKSQYEKNFS